MNVKLEHDNYIIILLKDVEYKVDTRKLEAVLSMLENRKVIIKSSNEVSELLSKYKLYDKDFLENINKL